MSNDALMNRLIGTLDKLDGKVDDLRDRTARVETQAEAAEMAREHSRNSSKMAMDGVVHQLVELRRETASGIDKMDTKYDRLEIRVVELEVARRLLDDSARAAAVKGGGIGGMIATAVSAAIAAAAWLAGAIHFSPK